MDNLTDDGFLDGMAHYLCEMQLELQQALQRCGSRFAPSHRHLFVKQLRDAADLCEREASETASAPAGG